MPALSHDDRNKERIFQVFPHSFNPEDRGSVGGDPGGQSDAQVPKHQEAWNVGHKKKECFLDNY